MVECYDVLHLPPRLSTVVRAVASTDVQRHLKRSRTCDQEIFLLSLVHATDTRYCRTTGAGGREIYRHQFFPKGLSLQLGGHFTTCAHPKPLLPQSARSKRCRRPAPDRSTTYIAFSNILMPLILRRVTFRTSCTTSIRANLLSCWTTFDIPFHTIHSCLRAFFLLGDIALAFSSNSRRLTYRHVRHHRRNRCFFLLGR